MSVRSSFALIAALGVGLPTASAALAVVMLATVGVSGLDIGLFAVMAVLTLIGVEGGFHRLVSHRAFKTRTFVRDMFVVFGSMAGQGPVIFWAATHRKHHSFTDVVGDPHSPLPSANGATNPLRGFLHGHFSWLFANEVIDVGRYAPDLIRDRALFNINRRYFLWVLLGLALPAAVGGVVTGSLAGAASGLLWGGLVRIFVVHHLVWSVNSFCHLTGTKAFKSGGNSRNNILLAILTLGGGWHNNHHAHPGAASTSIKWWQIDVIGLVIRTLSLLGLAWDLREIPKTSPRAAGGDVLNQELDN